MTQTVGRYDLYFDGQGNMLRNKSYAQGMVKIPNEVFIATLSFEENHSKYHSYGSSRWWTVRDLNTGRTYPVFASDLHKIILNAVIDHGVVEEREYVGLKKGSSFGIVPYIR